ncbi:hypothetical protein AB0L10_38045 [Streptomyces flaveolus]|uniref:hypothetical protein n=1 Tax=Streptomyces flaveolus TaxID=67297 RepID=UPI003444E101
MGWRVPLPEGGRRPAQGGGEVAVVVAARDMGCPVAYLPGLTTRRMADFYSGDT